MEWCRDEYILKLCDPLKICYNRQDLYILGTILYFTRALKFVETDMPPAYVFWSYLVIFGHYVLFSLDHRILHVHNAHICDNLYLMYLRENTCISSRYSHLILPHMCSMVWPFFHAC